MSRRAASIASMLQSEPFTLGLEVYVRSASAVRLSPLTVVASVMSFQGQTGSRPMFSPFSSGAEGW
jgi:hypothetical protein